MLNITIAIRNFARIIITCLGIGKPSILLLAKHDDRDAESYRILSRDFSKYRSGKSCKDTKEQDFLEK